MSVANYLMDENEKKYDKFHQVIMDSCCSAGWGGWHQIRHDVDAARKYTYKNLDALSSIPIGRSACDIGCAFGSLAVYLAREGWAKVRAIDFVDEHIPKRFLASEGVDFKRLDICKDPLEGKFDLIIFTQVFEHLHFGHLAVLEKIFAALNSGGRLLFSTPGLDLGYAKGLYQKKYGIAYYTDLHVDLSYEGDQHYYIFSKKELLLLFLAAGFGTIQLQADVAQMQYHGLLEKK